MTIIEAADILRKHLAFGDPIQIRAVDFMSAVEVALATKHLDEEECDECHGSGDVDCTCPYCDDQHTAECEECAGTGLNNYTTFGTEDVEVIAAAKWVEEYGWPEGFGPAQPRTVNSGSPDVQP